MASQTDAPTTRYVVCINCAYAIEMETNNLLRCAMDCPDCGCKKQFGPGVYKEKFNGYTASEVWRIKKWARVDE